MKSLRTRLTLRLLIGGALLLGAAAVVLHWQVRRVLTAQFDATVRATVQSLVNLSEQKHGEMHFDYPSAHMPQFEQDDGSAVFLIRTIDGREIRRSPSLGSATLPLRAQSGTTPDFFDATLPDGRPLRCAGVRFQPRDEEEEEEEERENRKKRRTARLEVVLVVGCDRTPLDHQLTALRQSLLLVGAGALAVLAALVRWEVRRGLAPLDRLGESVAAVQADSLATRFAVAPLPTELQPIAARLNELLSRLESAFARERRFTSTAAHELRTPLAELRALAEVNLTTPATEAERAESWHDALSTTLRMESLALRLLELARLENTASVVRAEPVFLASAFTEAWRPLATRATARGLTAEIAIPADLAAATDPALLAVILGNLCANAADHAPAGAVLRATGSNSPRGVSLETRNPAGGLTAEDIPHLFERFWRKDAARTDSRHHGLGLALAAECAVLIGGTLAAHLDHDAVVFTLNLPPAPPE